MFANSNAQMSANVRRSLPVHPSKSKGASLLGTLVLAVLIGFWIYIVILLMPVYMDGKAVESAFTDFPEKFDKAQTKASVEGYLSRQFQIDAVYDVDPKAVEVEKTKQNFDVKLDYERRVPLTNFLKNGNVDLVLKFHHEVTVPRKIGN